MSLEYSRNTCVEPHWLKLQGCFDVTVCLFGRFVMLLAVAAYSRKLFKKNSKDSFRITHCHHAWIFSLFRVKCGTDIWWNPHNQLKHHSFQRFVTHIICFSGPLCLLNITLQISKIIFHYWVGRTGTVAWHWRKAVWIRQGQDKETI